LTPTSSMSPSITPSISITPTETPSITPTKTPTITPSITRTPTVTPIPINEYTLSRCDTGDPATWRTSQILAVGSVYSLTNPSGAGNGTQACYLVETESTTFNPPNIGTAYLLSGGCGDSRCIVL
jgi:hypothetical protein